MSQILFFGEANGKRLFKADTGHQDVDLAIKLTAESDPMSPAGPGGESIFTALTCIFLHTMAATVIVTPILDGTDLEPQNIVLSSKATRTRETFELGLSIPITHAATERGRCAPRGTWFSCRLEVTAIATGDLICEGVAVEQEVVQEGITTQTFTPS